MSFAIVKIDEKAPFAVDLEMVNLLLFSFQDEQGSENPESNQTIGLQMILINH